MELKTNVVDGGTGMGEQGVRWLVGESWGNWIVW